MPDRGGVLGAEELDRRRLEGYRLARVIARVTGQPAEDVIATAAAFEGQRKRAFSLEAGHMSAQHLLRTVDDLRAERDALRQDRPEDVTAAEHAEDDEERRLRAVR